MIPDRSVIVDAEQRSDFQFTRARLSVSFKPHEGDFRAGWKEHIVRQIERQSSCVPWYQSNLRYAALI